MSVFVGTAPLGLLVAVSGMAGISGSVLARSIEEGDADSAWIWAALFAAASLVSV